LGIDEHTACIIDLQTQRIDIQGIGNVTIRKKRREIKFGKGEQISLDILLKEPNLTEWHHEVDDDPKQSRDLKGSEADLLKKVNDIENSFQTGLTHYDSKHTTTALLKLDSLIWKAQRDLENEENIAQAREILRDSIVLLGAELEISPRRLREFLTPLVEAILQLRERFRNEKKWSEADRIREILQHAHIQVEDTKDGFQWYIIDEDV
jgi:cysteinyl-tRNA synthetase